MEGIGWLGWETSFNMCLSWSCMVLGGVSRGKGDGMYEFTSGGSGLLRGVEKWKGRVVVHVRCCRHDLSQYHYPNHLSLHLLDLLLPYLSRLLRCMLFAFQEHYTHERGVGGSVTSRYFGYTYIHILYHSTYLQLTAVHNRCPSYTAC